MILTSASKTALGVTTALAATLLAAVGLNTMQAADGKPAGGPVLKTRFDGATVVAQVEPGAQIKGKVETTPAIPARESALPEQNDSIRPVRPSSGVLRRAVDESRPSGFGGAAFGSENAAGGFGGEVAAEPPRAVGAASSSEFRADGITVKTRGLQLQADGMELMLSSAGGQLEVREAWERKYDEAFAENTEFEFFDTPLTDVADYLADYHSITILIDEPALAEDGIPTDEPITRALAGVSLASGLDIILEPLSLTWYLDNEVMLITTTIQAESIQQTRVYDLQPLAQSGYRDVDALAEVITATIERQSSWDEDLHAASLLGTKLMLTHSPLGHRETKQLLERLLRANGTVQSGAAGMESGMKPAGGVRSSKK